MAKKGGKVTNKLVAKLVTQNRAPCAFCQRDVDDEITYGKLYSIGDIQCHYFCVLLSCCLIQKGRDDHGLFGFLYPDILAELERSKKHRCSYCSKGGATLGCSISQCRKQFHLPCGRQRNAVSLFYGNYKSFCQAHAPKQNIPELIMSKARVRMKEKNKALKAAKANGLGVAVVQSNYDSNDTLKTECVCVICYEEVDAFPTIQTFWAPCCASDAWFHRSCLERMALSAGMHYLKCPLCNDKDNFYQAVIQQGYYVPDRDAAWELEQNAFAEIYERPLSCSVSDCKCPLGPNHDAEIGIWDIKLCLLCGSVGIHAQCLANSGAEGPRFICPTCQPAAPRDMEKLAAAIESIIVTEQARSTSNVNHPVMTSRMSLRRTKQRMAYMSLASDEGSSSTCSKTEAQDTSNTIRSRQELNIKPPKYRMKPENVETYRDADRFMSPVKLLELTLREKKRRLDKTETESIVFDERLVERLRVKMRKPKPLCEKRKIVDGMIEEYLNNYAKEKGKTKEPIKEWNSPKKEAATSENTADENQIQHASSEKASVPSEDKAIVARTIDNAPVVEDDPSTISQRKSRQTLGTPGSSGVANLSAVGTECQDTPIDQQGVTVESPQCKFKHENAGRVDLNDAFRLMSPMTLLKNTLRESKQLGRGEREKILSDDQLEERLRRKMRKPKPLSKKLKIVYCVLDEYLSETKENGKDETVGHCKSPQKEAITEDKTVDENLIRFVYSEEESARSVAAPDVTVASPNPPPVDAIDNPPAIDEESSNSTFVLPSEFVADRDSDDSLPIFDTPKKLKTVNIQKDSSMEISENNDVVNIDLVKMDSKAECDIKIPPQPTKCALKFNPKDKEALKNADEGIDIESFKSQYLNEVGRHFKCEFNHRHVSRSVSPQLKTAIDFAIDANAKIGRKRKSKRKKGTSGKRRKVEDVVLRFEDSVDKKKKRRKQKSATSLSITNEDMQLKISLRKKRFRLKIMKSESKTPPASLKQYVLKYADSSSKELIEKPEKDVSPIKRKYIKQIKSPDNLKQTSLHSFFKKTSPKE